MRPSGARRSTICHSHPIPRSIFLLLLSFSISSISLSSIVGMRLAIMPTPRLEGRDNDIRKIQGKRIKHFEIALLSGVFQYLALYSCCCNANEVLAFLQIIQKHKLYLQLHKKKRPKGEGNIENHFNLRSINTRLREKKRIETREGNER